MKFANDTDLGSYVEIDGRPAVRFVRAYPHPIAKVWAAVSDPDQLGRWFPSKVALDPRPGGAVTFSSDPNIEDTTGTVLAYSPPHRVAFTWGNDALEFTLEPLADGGCRLTLLNFLEHRTAAARNAAGWQVCLGELTKALDGSATDGPHSADALAWAPLYEAYVAAGLPAGAPVPDASAR